MENITLKQLNYNIRNAQITALLICKQNPNIFGDKAVMEITLRDSVEDYVNCTIWGSETYIESFNNLKIGDLLTINYPQIKCENGESIYSPQSSSIFSLVINEGCGDVILNTERQERQRLSQMAKIPITNGKNSLVQLSDIISFKSSSTAAGRKFVDLLVCVRVIRPQRQITTKVGKKLTIREVIVFDQSSNGMLLNFFNENYSEMAESWIPYNTILYLNDVQVEYSDFHHTAILKIAKKTLITEDPKIRKAYELLTYSQRVPRDLDISFATESGVPELSSITHVMSVNHLYELGLQENSNEEQITAVLYAVITKYDIDGSNQRLVKKRCLNCNRYVPFLNEFCDNEDCSMTILNDTASDLFIYNYDIMVSISDHSGTIQCRLLKEYAEKLIGCPAKDFLSLDEKRKSEIKLNLLMERCRVKVVLRRKSVLRSSMTIIVLECVVADFEEVTKKITVY